MAERKTFKKNLPICMHCMKIKDDKESWNQIEKYIHELSGVVFIHSLCPRCMEENYPEL